MSDFSVRSDIAACDPDPLCERRNRVREAMSIDSADIERGQTPFFAFQPTEAEFRTTIKRAVAQDIKECRWSREELAEGLSQLLGRTVTVAQLDAITAESKSHRFPAEWIPAWVRLTTSHRVLDLLCAESGLWVVDAAERDYAEYGRIVIQRKKDEKRAEEIERRVGGRA